MNVSRHNQGLLNESESATTLGHRARVVFFLIVSLYLCVHRCDYSQIVCGWMDVHRSCGWLFLLGLNMNTFFILVPNPPPAQIDKSACLLCGASCVTFSARLYNLPYLPLTLALRYYQTANGVFFLVRTASFMVCFIKKYLHIGWATQPHLIFFFHACWPPWQWQVKCSSV